MVPKADFSGAPPANGCPPGAVWQEWQSAASATYLPRATSSRLPPGAAAAAGGAPTLGGTAALTVAAIANGTAKDVARISAARKAAIRDRDFPGRCDLR
jgi:hypothetical protein